MWYVLYCPNKEQDIIRLCQTRISEQALRDVFVLTYDQMRRYEGAWHMERKPMFPDYVFLESGNDGQLQEELKDYKEILCTMAQDDMLIPLHEEEESFLKMMCGKEHHFAMSKGVIRGGKTTVTEGPLRGRETLITKIDRHKRLAYLQAPAFSMGKVVKAGLEITEKTEG